jgi:hypothetical protein
MKSKAQMIMKKSNNNWRVNSDWYGWLVFNPNKKIYLMI